MTNISLVSQLYWRYTCELEYLANRAGGLDASRLVLVCNINQELRTVKRTGTGAGRGALNRIADCYKREEVSERDLAMTYRYQLTRMEEEGRQKGRSFFYDQDHVPSMKLHPLNFGGLGTRP